MVATWAEDQIQIVLPDEKVLTTASYPQHAKWEMIDHLRFSSCGRYLWYADTPPEGNHALLLLEVPSLKLLDRIDAPNDPENVYDTSGPFWNELELKVWPQKNVLAVSRWNGDSFQSLTFHKPYRRKISTHSMRISEETDNFDTDPVYQIAFHPTEDNFIFKVAYGAVHEASWPDCTIHAYISTMDIGLKWHWELSMTSELVYCGDHVLLAEAEPRSTEIVAHLLDRNTLQWRGALPYFINGFLANGMLTNTEEERLRVLTMKLSDKRSPVVATVDAKWGQFENIFEKQNNAWVDITADVCWMDTPFSHEPGD